jgi:hypothetical protein
MVDDFKHDYAKEKLWQALDSLVGAGDIQLRLTYAAEYLMRLQPRDLPSDKRAEFEELIATFTKTPLSDNAGVTARLVSSEDGTKLARQILSLYIDIRGGI